MTRRARSDLLSFALLLSAGCLCGLLLTGCHSAHVDVVLENRTRGPVRLLEVDYPSASFGADSLAAEAIMHYRIQVQGSGPVKVQYTDSDGKPRQIEGPSLYERQEGRLDIVLLPDGKAEFQPILNR